VIYIFAYFTARAYQQLKTFLISTTCYSRQIESIPLGGVTLAANFNLIKPAACTNSDACRRLVKFNSHARLRRIRMCACLGVGGDGERVWIFTFTLLPPCAACWLRLRRCVVDASNDGEPVCWKIVLNNHFTGMLS
jgi:hypothetical protein